MTQGKTFSGNGELYSALYAIDKDLSTLAITYTSNGDGWLKLEFDKILFIRTTIIHYIFYTNWYNPNGHCVQGIKRFKYCVNLHSDVDVSVYQGEVKQKSCGTLQLTYGLEQSDQIYTLLCNTMGNIVLFSKSTPTMLVVSEVVVISIGE